MNKFLLPAVIILIVIATAVFLTLTDKKDPEQTISPSPFLSPSSSLSPSLSPSPSSGVSGFIKVDEPISGQLVTSPLKVSGQARGTWYFEASFPVKIYDGNGTELGVAPAQASGEWMTQDFVPFQMMLYFKKPMTANGTLVLEKDNPSGLPEHAAELRIPVRFDLANWPTAGSGCFVAGCSGQLCVSESEKDIVTTCEYKEEYACYKTAECKRQEDGKCGWTPTEGLVACLSTAFQNEPSPQ